jgi:hypothetical protein
MGSLDSLSEIDFAYLVSLTAIGLVVIGAMLTPLVLALTRPIHPHVEQLARRAAWVGCKSIIARGVRWVCAIATAGAALAIMLVVCAGPATADPAGKAFHLASATIPRLSAAQAIEQLTSSIKAAKKPLPMWAAELFLKAVNLYAVHKLIGKFAQLVGREVATCRSVVVQVPA